MKKVCSLLVAMFMLCMSLPVIAGAEGAVLTLDSSAAQNGSAREVTLAGQVQAPVAGQEVTALLYSGSEATDDTIVGIMQFTPEAGEGVATFNKSIKLRDNVPGGQYTLKAGGTTLAAVSKPIDLAFFSLEANSTATVKVNETADVSGMFTMTPAEYAPGEKTVTYTSKNDGIASVDASTGVVTGKTAGSTAITAKVSFKTSAGEEFRTVDIPVTVSESTAPAHTVTVESKSVPTNVELSAGTITLSNDMLNVTVDSGSALESTAFTTVWTVVSGEGASIEGNVLTFTQTGDVVIKAEVTVPGSDNATGSKEFTITVKDTPVSEKKAVIDSVVAANGTITISGKVDMGVEGEMVAIAVKSGEAQQGQSFFTVGADNVITDALGIDQVVTTTTNSDTRFEATISYDAATTASGTYTAAANVMGGAARADFKFEIEAPAPDVTVTVASASVPATADSKDSISLTNDMLTVTTTADEDALTAADFSTAWSVKDAGETGAKIDNNTLTFTGAGTATIQADVTVTKEGDSKDAKGTQTFEITVTETHIVAITANTVPGSVDVATGSIELTNGMLTVTKDNAPVESTGFTVAWTLVDAGETGAALDGTTLTFTAAGSITLGAVATVDGVASAKVTIPVTITSSSSTDATNVVTATVNTERNVVVVNGTVTNIPVDTEVSIVMTKDDGADSSEMIGIFHVVDNQIVNIAGLDQVAVTQVDENYKYNTEIAFDPAVDYGIYTVTATPAVGPQATTEVTIAEPTHTYAVTITGLDATAEVGDTVTLADANVKATKDGADVTPTAVVWSVEDAGTTGAVIDGNALTFTAAGTAKIVATATVDGKQVASEPFAITVSEATPPVDTYAVTIKTGTDGLPTSAEVGAAAITLQDTWVTVTKNGEAFTEYDSITWASSSDTVATIEGNTLTIVGAGTTQITATVSVGAATYSASVNFTVNAAGAKVVTLDESKTAQIMDGDTYTNKIHVEGTVSNSVAGDQIAIAITKRTITAGAIDMNSPIFVLDSNNIVTNIIVLEQIAAIEDGTFALDVPFDMDLIEDGDQYVVHANVSESTNDVPDTHIITLHKNAAADVPVTAVNVTAAQDGPYYKDGTVELTAALTPAGATYKTIEWSIPQGETAITVVPQADATKATVTVTENVDKDVVVTATVTNNDDTTVTGTFTVNIDLAATGIAFTATTFAIEAGQTVALPEINVLPEGVSEELKNEILASLTWAIEGDDTTIATIDQEAGTITAADVTGEKTATLKATAGSFTAGIELKVVQAGYIDVSFNSDVPQTIFAKTMGETEAEWTSLDLSKHITIAPTTAADASVTWELVDADAETFEITPAGILSVKQNVAGSVEVKVAVSKDDSSAEDSITINLSPVVESVGFVADVPVKLDAGSEIKLDDYVVAAPAVATLFDYTFSFTDTDNEARDVELQEREDGTYLVAIAEEGTPSTIKVNVTTGTISAEAVAPNAISVRPDITIEDEMSEPVVANTITGYLAEGYTDTVVIDVYSGASVVGDEIVTTGATLVDRVFVEPAVDGPTFFAIKGLTESAEGYQLVIRSGSAVATFVNIDAYEADDRYGNFDGYNPDDGLLASSLAVPFKPVYGDIDGDNTVNGDDLILLRAAYGTVSGEADYSADADLNADGVVNAADLATLLVNYNKTLEKVSIDWREAVITQNASDPSGSAVFEELPAIIDEVTEILDELPAIPEDDAASPEAEDIAAAEEGSEAPADGTEASAEEVAQ